MEDRSMGLWGYRSIGLWGFVFCVFLASILCAQEENEARDKIIDLPPVKIEIVDTTQLNIPREKFRSFAKPDSTVYAPLSPKERPWYLPPTSVPEKLREVSGQAEKDLLFSLAAHSGVPAALIYQMLLVRGFGRSELLLDMGRSMLKSERTAKLVNNPSKGQGRSTVDKLTGAFAHQSSRGTNLKMDVQYDGKEFSFLDVDGKRYPTDRSLAGLSVDWGQKLSNDARSSLNIRLSSLRMEDPLSSGSHSGLDLETGLGIRVLWPRSNPIDAGLGIGYFTGENAVGTGLDAVNTFREAILGLYLRDNQIRIWPFVLGAGMELLVDARTSSTGDGDWLLDVYPNPDFSAMTRIGAKTVLQLGAEGYISRQELKEFYIDRDCVRFNPDLNVERTWELNASLAYRLTRKFTATVGAFGRKIRDLTVFKETSDGILSWIPDSRDSARISGFSSGWELRLIDGRVKQSFEYIHEFHDQKEYIPYRPRDRGGLTITYFAPFGLEPSLSGEFCGTRYVDTSGKNTLSGYSLWKPRISKTFGKYVSVFLAAEFYVGRDDYQIWRGYELPSQIVDFGLKLVY
jgi:hypothetical protein